MIHEQDVLFRLGIVLLRDIGQPCALLLNQVFGMCGCFSWRETIQLVRATDATDKPAPCPYSACGFMTSEARVVLLPGATYAAIDVTADWPAHQDRSFVVLRARRK